MSSSQITELYSGMPITPSPERAKLSDILSTAYSGWYTSYGRQQYVDEANAIAATVADIPGVSLIQPGDYGEDYRNRCAHYVFGTVNGEDWATPYAEIDSGIWLRTRSFLEERGYELIEKPAAGDVATYSFSPPAEIYKEVAEFQHFGIVQADGSFNSKFNQGPVVNHPSELVPTDYGDHIYFLGSIARWASED